MVRQLAPLKTDLAQSRVLGVTEYVSEVVVNVPPIMFLLADMKERLTDLNWQVQARSQLVGAIGKHRGENFSVMKTMSSSQLQKCFGRIFAPNCIFGGVHFVDFNGYYYELQVSFNIVFVALQNLLKHKYCKKLFMFKPRKNRKL